MGEGSAAEGEGRTVTDSIRLVVVQVKSKLERDRGTSTNLPTAPVRVEIAATRRKQTTAIRYTRYTFEPCPPRFTEKKCPVRLRRTGRYKDNCGFHVRGKRWLLSTVNSRLTRPGQTPECPPYRLKPPARRGRGMRPLQRLSSPASNNCKFL